MFPTRTGTALFRRSGEDVLPGPNVAQVHVQVRVKVKDRQTFVYRERGRGGRRGFRSGQAILERGVVGQVHVTVAVESDVEDTRIPVPHIVRAANRKDVAEISREIRGAQVEEVPYAAARRLLPAWLLVPGFVRRFLWGRWLADPVRRKRLTGTTFVTSIGMFGSGTAWGIPSGLNYPVGLAIGGIGRKPGVVGPRGQERIEVREILALTITLDHDIVDGAPAARFVARLRELVERGGDLVAVAETSGLSRTE